jgi:hypothetical protein
MLDIKTRKVAITLQFPLVDETDAPLLNEDGTPCMATIHGPGSRKYIGATARRQAKLLAKVQKGQALTLSADETLRNQAEFLADITDDLGVAYDDLDGRDKFIAIYSDPGLGFIAEQVAKKSGDWANFSQGSANN